MRLDHLNFLRKKERFNKSACVVRLLYAIIREPVLLQSCQSFAPLLGPQLAFEGETLTPDGLRFPGSFAAVVPPVPIPNTAVKRCRADGSACIACARVGRCRGNLEEPALINQRGLFISVVPTIHGGRRLRCGSPALEGGGGG